jgi:hypothetical protein
MSAPGIDLLATASYLPAGGTVSMGPVNQVLRHAGRHKLGAAELRYLFPMPPHQCWIRLIHTRPSQLLR